MFKSTGVAMYNEQAPERAISIFEARTKAQAEGKPIYVQIPAQPLAFDFSWPTPTRSSAMMGLPM